MKRSILIILSIILAVTVSAQDVSSALRQAQARFDSGNETGGIELVNKILAKYPDNKEAKDMLAKFNKVIKDREIEADWKLAVSQNTFESYQQFRAKHPNSQYDDMASDNMAKKLADRFTSNSTYTDRTKAESYAKKDMTKDYIANKWKVAMAKKNSTQSSYSNSSSSSSTSTSRSSYSTSSTNRTYNSGSTYSGYSGYKSSKNSLSSFWDKHGFNIGAGALVGYDAEYGMVGGAGVYWRLFRHNSLFNFNLGCEYALYSNGDPTFQFPLMINWNMFSMFGDYSREPACGYIGFGITPMSRYGICPYNIQVAVCLRHWDFKFNSMVSDYQVQLSLGAVYYF